VKIPDDQNPNDPIRNVTRDIPSCNAVLQPTAPPRVTDCAVVLLEKSCFYIL